jgi:L-threonylcarbamoyladenylate synthase
MSATDLQKAIDVEANVEAGVTVAVWSRTSVQVPAANAAQFTWQPMPLDAQDCAHQLFAQLRDFDAHGVARIWVETPPQTPEWDGVRDRLTRAATPTR